MLALVFLLPVFGTLYYDGFRNIPKWHPLFWGLSAVGLATVFCGFRILVRPQRVGGNVSFKDGGFDINVRSFFRADQQHSLVWEDIESVKLIVAPRGGDVLAFRLSPSAAVAKGLIQPSTRFNASKKLVKREIALPMNLCNVGVNEAFRRFEASANHAGAKLVAASAFNAVIIQHKVWAVEH
ncbi:MAG: hypothetical protein ABJF50_23900 [Paracoccaceae bacterium]